MIRTVVRFSFLTLMGVALLATTPVRASAAYPTNICVARKLKAAGRSCRSMLKAWSRWQQRPAATDFDSRRDVALARAESRLASVWARVESSAAKRNVDCADTTMTAVEAQSTVGSAVAALDAAVASGVDNSDRTDRLCRARILKAASTLCTALLGAESALIRDLAGDPDRTQRAAERSEATSKFTEAFAKTVAKAAARGVSCPGTLLAPDVVDDVSALAADLVTGTTISPAVATASWTMITPDASVPYQGRVLTPICSRGTPYVFFAKRGTVNKLLVYYQGGGACWDALTCFVANTFKDEAGPGDNPGNYTTGFADISRPDNPFRDWNAVMVPYCTGDIHWGDRFKRYGSGKNIRHLGRENAAVAEKWAREHFVNPDEVFVAGSSAGAYGAMMNTVFLMHDVYPASQFDVLADAGNGVITQDWLSNNISNWGVENTIPTFIPGLEGPIDQLSIVDLWVAEASFFPRARFAQYTTAYDGGSGSQTNFYQVMLNPADPLVWTKWWEPTCAWHDIMRQFAQDTATVAPNYRYYIGAGNRHTMWGSDKVYTDTAGTVPTVVSWINAMLDGGPDWENVECTDCNLVATCQGGTSAGLSCASDGNCPGGFCEMDKEPAPLAPPYLGGGIVGCP